MKNKGGFKIDTLYSIDEMRKRRQKALEIEAENRQILKSARSSSSSKPSTPKRILIHARKMLHNILCALKNVKEIIVDVYKSLSITEIEQLQGDEF
jgi:hypothetical protein